MKPNRLAIVAYSALLFCACASKPVVLAQTPSYVITDSAATRLGRALEPRFASAPQESGIVFLTSGADAFAARAALADLAERSIDVQYYVWHADVSGSLLLERLWAAAQRGVRVRILLDDIHTQGQDRMLAALDADPNIEVRLFNPFSSRAARWLDFLADFGRINRRMHNKAFIADNQAGIVGGRNVGDEYFEADPALDFADLDVLAAGAVVADLSGEFDLYWNNRAAVPMAALAPAATREDIQELAAAMSRARQDPRATRYLAAIADTPFSARLRDGTIELFRGRATLLYDDPKKIDEESPADSLLLLPKLVQQLEPIERELLIVSPYFVPANDGVQTLAALARTARVQVLTNSLAANDVVAAHAGYARYRSALLQAGVELYELKPVVGSPSRRALSVIGGSSRASLHAKTMVADRARFFVGSFNMDPRSTRLNTELGLVFENSRAARALAEGIAQVRAERAYAVKLTDAEGTEVEWIDARTQQHHATEPESSIWRRFAAWLLSLLPIERQL